MNFLLKSSFFMIAVVVLCRMLANFILYLDFNKRVYNHAPGTCSSVAGIDHGADDMEVLQDGIVIISAGLRLHNNSELSEAQGKMFAYNASGRTAWELPLESKTLTKKNFNPHGISVFEEQGRINIFVVNHRPKGEAVEVFTYNKDDKKLTHARTVKSPLFTSLDNIVAVSRNQFYVINSHYFKDWRGRFAELYLQLSLGNIVYFDGKNAKLVAQFVPLPTGIALDKSKRYLYVSSLSQEKIIVYKIEQDMNITYHSEILLHTAPDNIVIDPLTADLWVGCHPVKNRYFRHENSPKSIFSPSQILKIRGRPARGHWSITEPYANDGASLSGSSVAVKLKNHILVGSVHDKLMSCELDDPKLV